MKYIFLCMTAIAFLLLIFNVIYEDNESSKREQISMAQKGSARNPARRPYLIESSTPAARTVSTTGSSSRTAARPASTASRTTAARPASTASRTTATAQRRVVRYAGSSNEVIYRNCPDCHSENQPGKKVIRHLGHHKFHCDACGRDFTFGG